ncbi:MAG: biotin--[acetyl-CoA-carboxylase] ligase [Nitrospinae bacterium]|nr:biotin--[acetyl-CoA-carboxylase] ligase [Nitrospinota bacterium]
MGQDKIESIKIKEHLTAKFIGSEIYIFDTVESTNDTAKGLANKGCKEGTVVIADLQSKGRGRLGRRWGSPAGVGVYLSIILRPSDITPQLTLLAAVAAAEAINKSFKFQVSSSKLKNLKNLQLATCNLQPKLKWPNDIIINGKKAGGILTESIANGKAVIVGMGINVNSEPSSFTDELKSKATSIMIETGRNVDRNLLIAGLLNKFEYWYEKFAGGNETIITEKFGELSKEPSAFSNQLS